MKRTTIYVWLAVLVAGFVVGATAFAQGPGYPMRGPGMMKQMVSAKLDEALAQAKVTPDQRTAIYASRDRAFAAMETSRPDHRAQRDQVLALFESDQIDPAQLEALDAQARQQHETLRNAIRQAIVEIHDTLAPAQRKVVADYVRAHGPGAHGHGGPRG